MIRNQFSTEYEIEFPTKMENWEKEEGDFFFGGQSTWLSPQFLPPLNTSLSSHDTPSRIQISYGYNKQF